MENLDRQFSLKYPRTHESIIVQRNKRWIPKLRTYLDQRKQGDVMVVVGSLHLVGENGIIRLLEREGFEVKRVTADKAATDTTPTE